MNHPLSTNAVLKAAFRALLFLLIPMASFGQPANNTCANARLLQHVSTCITNSSQLAGQTFQNASNETSIASSCGTANSPDVYYYFVATSNVAYVSAFGLGGNWGTSMRMQILSRTAACAGLTEVTGACGTTSALATTLTVGQTYYIRIHRNTTASPTGGGGVWDFTICLNAPPSNDLCAGAVNIPTAATTCGTPINGALNGATTFTTNAAITCNTNTNDVWYTYTTQSTSATFTLPTPPTNARMQLFSGPCGTLTAVGTCSASPLTITTLTPNTTYYLRVYSTSNTAGTFTVCAYDNIVNNDCAGAEVIASDISCTGTTESMYAATNSAVAVTPTCATTATYDVWFKFIAQTTNPTISLSNFGAQFTNRNMELLSNSSGNSCAGSWTSLFCGTTSISADYLTPGSYYFIRVYSTTGTAPTTYANGRFDICIDDPVAPAPFNDECANAINLPIWNNCNNIRGTMAGATPSAIALGGLCTGPNAYDVWYKFTAINNTATLTLSSVGANFLNPGIELRTACGGVSLACASGTTLSYALLTAGTTYYVRVYSRTAPAPNGNARFNLCVQTTAAPLRFGNSYVNLSKKRTGGVIQNGDTLEIRMTVNHTSGTMQNMRYVDNIPTNTVMLTGVTDSIRIVTNEGITFRRYTLNVGDDAANYVASPTAGNTQIRLNLGFGTSPPGIPPANNNSTDFATSTGTMVAGSDNPRGGGGMLFAIAFRVRVNAPAGSIITLNAGRFIYRTGPGNPDITLTSTPYTIRVSDSLTLCSNSFGINNAVEFGGTFGSGTTLNRPTDLTNPIMGYSFIPDVSGISDVGDGRYAVVKNLSPRSSTISNARRSPNCALPTALLTNDPYNCSKRMFNGFWYIDGDHTGTNNAAGNAPPAAAANGGYMLMVNADYVASEVYRQTITNLCPNTYYEFSGWFKNICPTCGIDSAGTSTGRPGVFPNLTFTLDGSDRYNSGEIDTVGWSKRGFMFVTGPLQTSATFTIRNNSQGGGGNDWAMDDISIATCLPNMSYSPTLNPTVCENNPFVLRDTIRSYFNNYRHHQWQRSTDGGFNWTDLGVARDSTPVYNATLNVWQYVTIYTIPPGSTTSANDNDLYRVLVATTSTNLANPDCRVTDGVSFIHLNVENCGIPLATDLLSFNGRLVNGNGVLNWSTATEDVGLEFVVERSNDGINFATIGTLSARNNGAAINNYTFTDPIAVSGHKYYRIQLKSSGSQRKTSRIVRLTNEKLVFELTNLINPFADKLDFSATVPNGGKIDVILSDMSGKIVKKNSFVVTEGVNSISLPHTDAVPSGMYILQVSNNQQVITKKVVKKN